MKPKPCRDGNAMQTHHKLARLVDFVRGNDFLSIFCCDLTSRARVLRETTCIMSRISIPSISLWQARVPEKDRIVVNDGMYCKDAER